MNKKYISGCLVLFMLFCELGFWVRPAGAAGVNVALNKQVTVSAEDLQYNGNKENAVDGSADTKWSADSRNEAEQPHWLMVDLGGTYQVSGAEVTWKDKGQVVKYHVEVSADGAEWTTAADHRTNEIAEDIAKVSFQANDVRYVKVTIPYYAGPDWWPGIAELKVWGQEEGLTPELITSYSPMTISTLKGVAPVMPAEVQAHYSNGKTADVPVSWNAIDPIQYSSVGSFTVTGDVYGAPTQPVADIQVGGYRNDFVRGVDISTLTAIEDNGGKYLDSNGTERDLLDILKDRGVNYVRLRLWNDPQKSGGYNDKDDVIRLAKRVKEKGMKILLDFHYSDEWAHPGQQLRPKAWEGLSFEELKQEVFNYTSEVVGEMKSSGAMPDMVQIGNEINSGVLNGLNSNVNFDENVALLQSGVDGVRAVDGGDQVQIMIHLAEGGKPELFDWYFGEVEKRGLEYDIIGLSYYPFWHGTFADVRQTMNTVSAKYKKEVIIAETSYPFSYKNGDAHGNIIGSPEALHVGGATFPATVQGQHDAIAGIMDMIAEVPDGRGAGFFYWEPAWIAANVGWIASEGDAWENHAMFDYDEYPANGGYSFEGRALESLNVYKRGMDTLPVDRQQLWAAIKRGSEMVASDYTPPSWITLAPAIQAAKDVYYKAYTSEVLTQQETDEAAAALEAVMQELEVIPADRKTLEGKIAEAEIYHEADWSIATWTVFSKALAKAKQVLADPRATQTEVDQAVIHLEKAIQGLSDVDKTLLIQLIEETQQQSESSYTYRSWSLLQTALQAAIVVRDKPDAIQSEVNQALEQLQQAGRNLVQLEALTTGKTATASTSAGTGGGQSNSPDGAIDSNPNTSWGTDQSVGSWWQVDLGAVANIRKLEMSMWSGGIKYRIEVSEDNENYVTVVDTTSDVVVSTSPRHILSENTQARYIRVTITAGSTWVGFMDFEAYGTFPADKTALRMTVDSASKLQQNQYTAASWSRLVEALTTAKEWMEDIEASSRNISEADNALKEAMRQLVRQESTPGPSQPVQPSPPTSSGNPAVTVPAPETEQQTEKGSTLIKGVLTGKDQYSVSLNEQQLVQLVKGLEAGNQQLRLVADIAEPYQAVTFQLPVSSLGAWVKTQALQSLELSVGQTSVRIPMKSLQEIHASTAKTLDVVISKGSTANLSEQQKAVIGNHSVIDVKLLVDGEVLPWTDRAIEIAFSGIAKPKAASTVPVVQSLSPDGQMKTVLYSAYDESAQIMTFKPLQSGSFVIVEVNVTLTDIQAHSWAVNEVKSLYGKGIISGMSGDRFDPLGELTRAQFLHMVVQGIGESHVPNKTGYLLSDVSEGQWYTDSIRLGLEMNIIQGRPDGSFGVHERVTREDMAVILERVIQAVKQDETSDLDVSTGAEFRDNEDISGYAKQAVSSMQQLGLLKGMEDGNFAPKQTANRAQGAVVVARMMELLY
ncbi:glycosyl hydrolase 53 family protein [Paenibacillus illinoisensis]|uniref:glycosyl hydrolase 53 family protein n=1 Tax=Paenibacillus illinoisensis TaxID=59845 RepID=UPI003D2A0F81